MGFWSPGSREGEPPAETVQPARGTSTILSVHVRSTIVPSFPTPSGHSAILNGANWNWNGNAASNLQEVPIEGWRAVVSIVFKARKRPFYGPGRSVGPAGSVAPDGVNGSAESFVNVDHIRKQVIILFTYYAYLILF